VFLDTNTIQLQQLLDIKPDKEGFEFDSVVSAQNSQKSTMTDCVFETPPSQR
jgi:hypothetical protein